MRESFLDDWQYHGLLNILDKAKCKNPSVYYYNLIYNSILSLFSSRRRLILKSEYGIIINSKRIIIWKETVKTWVPSTQEVFARAVNNRCYSLEKAVKLSEALHEYSFHVDVNGESVERARQKLNFAKVNRNSLMESLQEKLTTDYLQG